MTDGTQDRDYYVDRIGRTGDWIIRKADGAALRDRKGMIEGFDTRRDSEEYLLSMLSSR